MNPAAVLALTNDVLHRKPLMDLDILNDIFEENNLPRKEYKRTLLSLTDKRNIFENYPIYPIFTKNEELAIETFKFIFDSVYLEDLMILILEQSDIDSFSYFLWSFTKDREFLNRFDIKREVNNITIALDSIDGLKYKLNNFVNYSQIEYNLHPDFEDIEEDIEDYICDALDTKCGPLAKLFIKNNIYIA